jgi:hypothetical protein
MASLGSAAQDAGNYPLANTTLTEIKLSGPENQDVAASLNNRTLLYNDQGRYAETVVLWSEHSITAVRVHMLAERFRGAGWLAVSLA